MKSIIKSHLFYSQIESKNNNICIEPQRSVYPATFGYFAKNKKN